MTTKKLTFRQKILVAGTLFGMFFGAGNLIFPVHLGQMAGSNVIPAIIGFIITAVGICIARVVWIFTIVPLHNDISTVAVAYPITWGLTSLAYMIYFRYVKKHKIGKMEQAA